MKNLQIGSSTFNSVNRVQFHTPDGDIVTYTDMSALEKKNVTLTENNVYHIYPDVEDGMSEVTVTVRNPGEGLNINGVIEEYHVAEGKTIYAGDFVEFVNQWNRGEIASANPSRMSACKLDNSRVLLAYIQEGDSGLRHLYIQVVKIGNNTIITGNCLNFPEFKYINEVSIKALNSTQAMVAFGGAKEDGDYDVWLKLLAINDSTITPLTEARYFDGPFGTLPTLEVLTENRFLTAFRTNSGKIIVQAYKVNDSSFSRIDKYELLGETDGIRVSVEMVLTKLSNNKALLTIPWAASGFNHLYACVVGLENDDITFGNIQDFSSFTGNASPVCTLSEELVVVFNGSQTLFWKIDGTNIIQMKQTQSADSSNESVTAYSIAALDQKRVLLTYRTKTSDTDQTVARVFEYLDGSVIRYEGTVFSRGDVDINILIVFSDSSCINIFANQFIAGVGFTIDGAAISVNQLTTTCVQPATSRLHNVGVAKEGGEEGDLIGVYCVSTI